MSQYQGLCIEQAVEGLAIGPAEEAEISKAAERAAVLEGLRNFAATIVLADNDMLRELNRTFRQIDAPTDVLSFPNNDLSGPISGEMQSGLRLEEDEAGRVDLGDIYISVERAQEQGLEFGNTLTEELCFLAVHGMLHLMGYDHIIPEDEALMRQRQREALGRA